MRLLAEHQFPARNSHAGGSLVMQDLGDVSEKRYAISWQEGSLANRTEKLVTSSLDHAKAEFDALAAAEMNRRGLVGGSGPELYTWEVWCSDRREKNDDCITGHAVFDFSTAVEELRVALSQRFTEDWLYAYIDGPDGMTRMERNPAPKPRVDDEDDLSEAARLAGMAFGVQGRNEVYGEDVEETGPYSPGR